tara:strand:- start:153 stop:335 length:183 start_codon:yes stop_codon:yes gene_type:complete
MEASLTFWIVSAIAIVGPLVLFEVGLVLRRVLNWRGLIRYQEPQGNRFAEASLANPWRRG